MLEGDLELILRESRLSPAKEIPAPGEDTSQSHVVTSFAVQGSGLYKGGMASFEMQSSGEAL